jgi:membrane protease YdiL (CAAX protease family)
MKRAISLEWQSPSFKRERSPEIEQDQPETSFVGDSSSLGQDGAPIDLESQGSDTLSLSLLLVEVEKPQEPEECSISARTALQHIFLFWIMTTPATCMLICLWVLRSVWAAALSFHMVACILLPYAYTRLCFSHGDFVELLRALWRNPWRQALFGCAYWLAFAGLGSAFYWTMGRLIVPNQKEVVEELGLSDDISVFVFSLYFCIANPLAEEFFWRGFLVQALGRKESMLWTISTMYASYHVVVLYTLQLDPVLVAMCSVLLIVAGRVFSLLAGISGVWSSALAHCAADMVIISVLFDWRFVQAQ